MRIISEENPLDIFCKASEILNDAVSHTLGPKGTNTAVVSSEGHYEIINDGKAIIESLTSLDPAIAPALQTLKQSSFETNRKAGDGTTSTIVMMNSLLHGARDYLNYHDGEHWEMGMENEMDGVPQVTPTQLRDNLEEIKDALLKELEEVKQEITEEDYIKIAKVALGSDKYADMLADIYQFLDKGQRPILLKADIDDVEVEKIDGLCLEKSDIRGTMFIETQELNTVKVACLYQDVNRYQEITQFLRLTMQSENPTILFYNNLSTDILENIMFNYSNGALKVIPVCVNGYGKGTYTVLKDIAEYVGTEVIDGSDLKINEVSKISLGVVDYATVNKERILLKKLENFSKNYLHLKTKSVIIRTGGTNKIVREEVYRRIEDAVNSLGNAIENGITQGAGLSYKLIGLGVATKTDINIPEFVLDSLSIINDSLMINNYENIFDSVTVVKEVIKNAFTMVSQVITTKRLIHENIR